MEIPCGALCAHWQCVARPPSSFIRNTCRQPPDTGTIPGQSESRAQSSQVGIDALSPIEGGTFSSADLSGKVAFVNFWGTWCAPCVDEMKHIQRLYERYHDDPDVALVTIGVEMDSANARELLSTALKVRKLSFPVLIGDGRVRTMVGGFPTTWYVDRQGRIAFIEEISYYGEYVDELDPFVWRIEDLKGTAAPPQ